jgi:hypothetical protein
MLPAMKSRFIFIALFLIAVHGVIDTQAMIQIVRYAIGIFFEFVSGGFHVKTSLPAKRKLGRLHTVESGIAATPIHF